ncbi:MAG: hypothetical protein KAX49_12510 [Halanaerobiales bacterium]|nr:hypothetical protein [Halanaerobiales bacterium]
MIKINLLPIRRTLTNLFCWLSFFFFLLIMLGHFSLVLINHELEIKLKDMVGYIISKDSQEGYNWQAETIKLKSELNDITHRIGVLENKKDFPLILLKIVTYLSEQIWLKKIQTMDNGKIFIEGQSFEYDQITIWIERLKELSEISGVDLLHFQGDEVIRFSIELTLFENVF